MLRNPRIFFKLLISPLHPSSVLLPEGWAMMPSPAKITLFLLNCLCKDVLHFMILIGLQHFCITTILPWSTKICFHSKFTLNLKRLMSSPQIIQHCQLLSTPNHLHYCILPHNLFWSIWLAAQIPPDTFL